MLSRIIPLASLLSLVQGAAYVEQWYYANDGSCNDESKYKIEGKALDVCINREDEVSSYMMTDCNGASVTYNDYDEYDCSGDVEVSVVIVGGCFTSNANDHRRIQCPTGASPWTDQQYDSILDLNYMVGDDLCSDDVMSYIIRYTDVCHSTSYPPTSAMYSCNNSSKTGTVYSYTGTDCKTLDTVLTDSLQTNCADFDFEDDDGFWHGNVGNSIFSCEITGTTKPTSSNGAEDDDDLSDAVLAGIICATVVVLAASAALVAYWFGLCAPGRCCRKKNCDETSLI